MGTGYGGLPGYLVLGTRYKVPDTRDKVPDTRYKERDTRYQVQGTRYRVFKKNAAQRSVDLVSDITFNLWT